MGNNRLLLFLSALFIEVLFAACSFGNPAPAPTSTLTPTTTAPVAVNPTATLKQGTENSQQDTPVPTQALAATATLAPTSAQPTTAVPYTPTALSDGVPGEMVRFGKSTPGPWYSGGIAFSHDGTLVAFALNDRVTVWDTDSFSERYALRFNHGKCQYLNEVAFSHDDRFLAVSQGGCWERDWVGYLIVWDLATEDLLREWQLELATADEPGHGTYHIPMQAFTFIPGSPSMAFATGNTIEIWNLTDLSADPTVLELGSKMFASELTAAPDGKFLYVLKEWWKTMTFPALYTQEFEVQTWNLQNDTISRHIEFPIDESFDLTYGLFGEFLTYRNSAEAIFEMTSLRTDETRSLPYRIGWYRFSPDGQFMAVARRSEDLSGPTRVEIWKTDTWRMVYSFFPRFDQPEGKYGFHDMAFSPDNTILALSHEERLTLWNITQVTK